MDNKTNTKPARPSHKGNLNTMAGRHHSLISRKKMSDSHKAYQEKVRKAMETSQQASPLSMGQYLSSPDIRESLERIITDIIKELQ